MTTVTTPTDPCKQERVKTGDMMNNQEPLDRLYALVANEEDARTCTDISEQACREVPGNFFKIIVATMLTQTGDLLINPKTVLAWLLGAVGAPSVLVGVLVPIRESGSLIPQLVIGAWVRRHPVRKGFWVLGAVLQGLCVLGMAAATWLLKGLAAGLAIVGLLALFSVSRGFCSVAMKDVQGKCIPRSRRGRLAGLTSTLSGLITLALGLLLFGDDNPGMVFYSLLLLAAGLAWWAAAAVFATVNEFRGETAGGGNALRQAFRSLGLLVRDAPFRDFVIARALLMASALSSPFLVVLAQDQADGAALLGGFVVASSLASTMSASVWGYMADASSRQVMIRGGGLAALVCLVVAALAFAGPRWDAGNWLYPAAFFVLAIAHAGVRIGRKTYLVDMAGGVKRTDYTAVSNSVIGVLLLAGGISAAVSVAGAQWALLLFGVMGVLGTVWSWKLRGVG